MKECARCKTTSGEYYTGMIVCKPCAFEMYERGETPMVKMNNTKVCTVCFVEKPRTEYYYGTRKCKPCFSAKIVINERKRTGATKRDSIRSNNKS